MVNSPRLHVSTLLGSAKKVVEKATGWSLPSAEQLPALVRQRKAHTFRFKDDGLVPNHPAWPLVIYRGVVQQRNEFDPAGVLEALFERNGWTGSWRGGVYDYVHYHSQIHEVLGVARGSAKVQFGGRRGRTLSIKAGDVAVLPAGTGHQCLWASGDFLAVGAYPQTGKYDECRTVEDRDRALKTVPKVPRPAKDPIFGADGPMVKQWFRRAATGRRRRSKDAS